RRHHSQHPRLLPAQRFPPPLRGQGPLPGIQRRHPHLRDHCPVARPLRRRRLAAATAGKRSAAMSRARPAITWTSAARDVLTRGPVIPVLVLRDEAHAVPVAEALLAGGIEVLEITLRSDAALPAIERLARDFPQALIGAGTVTNVEMAACALSAGARFLISPGLTPALLDAAAQGQVPLIPGISTVSELMTGLDRGYQSFKFFPAEAAGGIKALKAIAGPFPDVRFCPTGGITPDNALDYLRLPNVVCVGGS